MMPKTLIIASMLLVVAAAFAELDPGLLPAIQTDSPPVIDGVIGPVEWQTPIVQTFSAGAVPPAAIESGSFSGAADAAVEVRALYTSSDIYVALRVTDDVKASGDRVLVEVGNATLTLGGDGSVSGPGSDWAASVTQETGGWTMEMRIGGSIAAPTTIPGAQLSVNIRVEDDDDNDGAADGILLRSDAGAGIFYAGTPRSDLMTAILAIDAAALSPDAVGKLEKQSRRLTKAADELAWADAYGYASKSAAAKSLDRIRKAVRKLEKTRDLAPGTGFAAQIQGALDRIMVAVRLATGEMVLRAVQQVGITKAQEALDRLDLAEACTGSLDECVKLYRKAAKKAAKLYF
jgi:hypothetical protein